MKRPHVSPLSNRSQNDIIKSLGTFIRSENRIKWKMLKSSPSGGDRNRCLSRRARLYSWVHTMRLELESVFIFLLQKNGLDLKNIRGQGYDRAANMSGMYKGLKPWIQTHNEKALYVHCQTHCWSLFLVDSAKSSFIQKTNRMFSASVPFFKCQQSWSACCWAAKVVWLTLGGPVKKDTWQPSVMFGKL